MTMIPMLRAGTLAMVVAASALAGCSSPDQTMTAQGTRLLGRSGISTAAVNSPYSGAEWNAALEAAMTSDNGGE
jgi:hypothetical protein